MWDMALLAIQKRPERNLNGRFCLIVFCAPDVVGLEMGRGITGHSGILKDAVRHVLNEMTPTSFIACEVTGTIWT